MIRRKLALLFTVPAFIILLALTVIPHHHHHGEICIINPICLSDHVDDDANNTGHNHNDNHDHFCLLEQEIVLPSNNLQHILKAQDTLDQHLDLNSFYSTSNESDFINFIPPEYSRALFGFKSSLYSCFVSLSKGLRGPPIA